MDVLQQRGTSFNIGVSLGKVLKHLPILKAMETVTKQEIDMEKMKSLYKTYAPHLLEELRGLSEGLELPFNKCAALFSGYDMPKVAAMGCSTLITKDFYVRNYDFSPVLYDGFFSLLQPENAYATAGYNLQAIGRHDGVNEHGLVAGLHFVSNDEYTEGLSAWTSIRMLLDTCQTVEDAIRLLEEIPHSASYNFSLGDEKGNMAVVEASPEKVRVRRDEVLLTCVNHFQMEELQEKNRAFIENSINRNRYMQGLKSGEFNHKEMFQNFSDKHSPIFFTDYENLFGTLHTFSYSFVDSRILTTIAQSNQVIEKDFKDWVGGNNLKETEMIGLIENN
ncbi:C45 family peptidase [Bacillus haimaensis]|uniref:C45 family autoproteolytic acyltransferase/hydolase n=1 Tax=Bacillus haimaensis TaxID=3160967 RepID=UPI003AA7F1BE